MARRISFCKDDMVARTTDYGAAADPGEGEAIVGFTASRDGHALGVALIWDAAESGGFMLRIGDENRFPLVAGAGGGAGLMEIVGRVPYSAGDTVSLVAAGELAGTAVAAIIYANA